MTRRSDNEDNDVENENEDDKLLLSRNGSIRGQRNKVRTTQQTYLERVKRACEEKANSSRDFEKEEKHKCVVYCTSMGIVRKTFDSSRRLKALLQLNAIKFVERDVYLNPEFQRELQLRTGEESPPIPVVFVDGKLFGGADTIERLNENGRLRDMFAHLRMTNGANCGRGGKVCQCCGSSGYIPCVVCDGSRKSRAYCHHFVADSIVLRCSHCNATGIIRCPKCVREEEDEQQRREEVNVK